ncbi:PAS domain S-box protein [Candidatus Dojkabacteria bacterium]|nr:PAS domain S-box protein [Candidatus Dojkabacteria bacterium]
MERAGCPLQTEALQGVEWIYARVAPKLAVLGPSGDIIDLGEEVGRILAINLAMDAGNTDPDTDISPPPLNLFDLIPEQYKGICHPRLQEFLYPCDGGSGCVPSSLLIPVTVTSNCNGSGWQWVSVALLGRDADRIAITIDTVDTRAYIEAMLSDIVSKLSFPAVILEPTDDEVSISCYNSAFGSLVGCDAGDISGRSLTTIFPQDDEFSQIIIEHMVSGENMIPLIETEIIRSDGVPLTVWLCTVPIVISGQPRILSIFVDVTRYKQAEGVGAEDVLRNINMASQSWAHDVRNLIGLIKLGLDLLMLPDTDQDTVPETVGQLQVSLERMEIALSSLMTYIDLLTERNFEMGQISIVELLERVRAGLNGTAVCNNVNVTFSPIEFLNHNILANRSLALVVMENLIINAIKYTAVKEGRRDVVISATSAPDEIQISVADTGIGIPETELGHIFNRLTRASNVGDISGRGIGLATVQLACIAMGWRIFVESKEGHGTTFTIYIPQTEPTT